MAAIRNKKENRQYDGALTPCDVGPIVRYRAQSNTNVTNHLGKQIACANMHATSNQGTPKAVGLD
jgi:hypothetical protein